MHIDETQVMTPAELRTIFADLAKRGRRSLRTRQNTVIFQLSTCACLRASEIAGLRLDDLILDTDTPHIRLRKGVAKGGKPRKVPLAWVTGLTEALRAWRDCRLGMGAGPTDPLVCTLQEQRGGHSFGLARPPGHALTREQVWAKFCNCTRALSPERRAQIHTHTGRHTGASYNAGNRNLSLAAVSRALGHANISTTNAYLHVLPEEFRRPADTFGFLRAADTPDAEPASAE